MHVAYFSPVMLASEPAVEREQPVRAVHVEILVVQVVGKGMGVEGAVGADLDLVKAGMSDYRASSREGSSVAAS